jgi:hypothetical protein
MRRFLRRLLVSFERDDLFLRVVFVLSGVLFGGIGIALLVFVSTRACRCLLKFCFGRSQPCSRPPVDLWLRVAPCRRNRD